MCDDNSSGAADFYGLNHYTSNLCSKPLKNETSYTTLYSFFNEDLSIKIEQNPFWPNTAQQGMKVKLLETEILQQL